MNNSKRHILNVACVLAASIVGTTRVMGLDAGGTRWLKSVIYLIFFAFLSSSALFSSSYSCSLSSRLRKRS